MAVKRLEDATCRVPIQTRHAPSLQHRKMSKLQSPPLGRAFREWPRAQRAAQALGRLHIHSNPEPAVFWRATETAQSSAGFQPAKRGPLRQQVISRGHRLCRPSLRTGLGDLVKIAAPRAPLRCALGHSLVAALQGQRALAVVSSDVGLVVSPGRDRARGRRRGRHSVEFPTLNRRDDRPFAPKISLNRDTAQEVPGPFCGG